MATNNHVCVSTIPLYGILTTEKSDLLGRRLLAKAHHANFLANLVLGSRFPAELVDQVAEDLISLEYADMLQLWTVLTDRKTHRQTLFQVPATEGTVAEKAAFKELEVASEGIFCARMGVAKPDGSTLRYMHIMPSKNMLNFAELVPGAVAATGPALQYVDGHLQVSCNPGTDTSVSIEHMDMWPHSEKKRIGRLVQIDDIEEAIKQWDAKLSKSM